MIVLIPAYEPDDRLVQLVEALATNSQHASNTDASVLKILIVDDGSGPAFQDTFQQCRLLGAEVLTLRMNCGKGAALKQGFTDIGLRYPTDDVVCADCDGQHKPDDILRVAAALGDHRNGIVLGARQFHGSIPPKSRIGNGVARAVFHQLTGQRLQDTQTGLRAYAGALLPWLQTIDGDHFEYELEVLLAARRAGIGLHEVPIDTVYLDANHSTHFRPVLDSIRVLTPFVKFSMSSIIAFMIDAAAFFTLMALTNRLAFSIVVARLISASVNFVLNRRLVFAGTGRGRLASAARYASLVAVLLSVNYVSMRLLTGRVGLGLVPAKLLTEISLFLTSYHVQRRVIFSDRRPPSGASV